MDFDPTYAQVYRAIGPTSFPSHGGLKFGGENKASFPEFFFSSISFKFVRFTFSFSLTEDERVELAEGYPDFFKLLHDIKSKVDSSRGRYEGV